MIKKLPQKNVLGKGLEALIPKMMSQENNEKNDKGVQELEIYKIKPTKNQPRIIFEKEKLDELSNSIKNHGVIQPILVRPDGTNYKIVFGERRFRAVQLLGLKTIPAVIMEADDEKAYEISLIENIQRENLNAIEEGEAYNRLIKDFHLTQEEVAERVGKSRPTVANSIRLLKLSSVIQNFLIDKKLSMGHIRCLLSIDNEEKQLFLAKKAAEEQLSVREMESLVAENIEFQKEEINGKKRKKEFKLHDPHLNDYLEKIQHRLCCKVLFNGNTEKGKIQLQYNSKEDLHRILEVLGVTEQ